MKQVIDYRCLIQRNAERINELHGRVHRLIKGLVYGENTLEDQSRAAEEFRREYDALAFPGGADSMFEPLASGNPEVIEAAIAFLEVRPYFFRSGYMRKKLLRHIKRVEMNSRQRERLAVVLAEEAEYRKKQVKV